MRALVTGATGFIGGNLAQALLEQGYRVRALVRSESNLKNLRGLDVEMVCGDLRDRSSLDPALEHCDVLFHVAAAYTFWAPDPQSVYDTNVEGTRNILTAAYAHGIQKVVYTSTESTIGLDPRTHLGTQDRFVNPDELAGPYKKSKFEAEQVALNMHKQGLPVVVVNPTTPVGPGDVKPTPTGQFIVDFLNRRMPACVNTGLNVVDVRDVAQGHILALEKGRAGERYLLGHQNMTFKEVLERLEWQTGIPAPRVRIPVGLALGAAFVNQLVVRDRPPRIPLDGVRAARHFRYHDCSPAQRELGLPQTPIAQALAQAVQWFRENGYAHA